MTMGDYSKLSEGEKVIANELYSVVLMIKELRAEVTALKVAVTEATAFDQKDGIEPEAAGC